MSRKILLITATIFFIFSCNKKYDDSTNTEKSQLAEEALFDIEEDSFDDEELSFKPDLTGLDSLRGTYDVVINTDCDYYDNNWNLAGRLPRGQGIIIKERYYTSATDFSVFVEVQTADNGIKGYVNEKYITNFNSVNYDFWFKNVLMTRNYYYIEPVEYIYNEEIEKEIDKISWDKKSLLEIWRAFYSESRLRFTENHLVMGTDEGTWAFRLGEIINKSIEKNNTTYIIQLIDYPRGELEITLIDNGNSVTITQSIIKEKRSVDMGDFLLYTYVPYNKKKSEKTAKAVNAWCTEQIGKL